MEDIYVSYIREQLHAVLGIDSPSGCTEDVQQYLCDTLRAMGFAPRRLVKGGVHVTLGGEGEPLTLTAHADTLGADALFSEAVEADGVGLAVMNRLGRAAAFHIVEV